MRIFQVLAFFFSSLAFAANPNFQLCDSVALVHPSAVGDELGVMALISPIPAFQVGPRLSLLAAMGANQGVPVTRLDLNPGVEGTLWFVNAIGLGLGADLVLPSYVSPVSAGPGSGTIRFRVEPFLSTRILHFQEEGAWALRLGAVYDSFFGLGALLGISLQFSGVPGVSG